jgi:hypothetical protein
MIQSQHLLIPNGLIEEILISRQQNKGVRNSNRGGWHSKSYYRPLDHWQIWIDSVSDFVGRPIHNFWFNVNGPGHSNEWHNHGQRIRAVAVWYLQTPKNSGNFEYKIEERIESLEPSSGLLIKHQGGIDHRVTENLSTDLRISVAFNFA